MGKLFLIFKRITNNTLKMISLLYISLAENNKYTFIIIKLCLQLSIL